MCLIVSAIHNWYLGTFLQVRNLYIVLGGGGKLGHATEKL